MADPAVVVIVVSVVGVLDDLVAEQGSVHGARNLASDVQTCQSRQRVGSPLVDSSQGVKNQS